MLRAYPRGFAQGLLRAYEEHLCNIADKGRRDLRFKVQPSPHLTEVEQFKLLDLGDPWDEANLLPVFEYLLSSKKVRRS